MTKDEIYGNKCITDDDSVGGLGSGGSDWAQEFAYTHFAGVDLYGALGHWVGLGSPLRRWIGTIANAWIASIIEDNLDFKTQDSSCCSIGAVVIVLPLFASAKIIYPFNCNILASV